MGTAGSKSAAAAGYVFITVLPTAIWLLSDAEMGAGPFSGLALVGHLVLLVTYPILALQPVLAARLKWLDRLYGLDQVYAFHKAMAMTGGLFLLVYPFLMASETGQWGNLIGLGLAWPGILLRLAAAITLIQVVVSTIPRLPGIDHERWRAIHNVLALAILLLLLLQIGGYHINSPLLQICWGALGVAGFVVWAHHKLIRPAVIRRNAYSVVEVRNEARGVWTVTLAPPDGSAPLDYVPGQFQFFTPLPQGEEHPFTISSAATGGTHSSTIKESGDFTSGIRTMKRGDRVAVDGPFGRFSYVFHPAEDALIFIAGGIGITPLVAMLRSLRASGARRSVRLFYGNRTEEDIVFRAELERMEDEGLPRLRTTHVLSRPGSEWSGARGHVAWETIKTEVEAADETTGYYVCGPPAMLDSILPPLYRSGVTPKRVHFERFAL